MTNSAEFTERPGRLAGEVVLVTGATIGLGKEIARVCAREGARVVVTGRDAGRGSDVASEIVKMGGDAVFVAADLSTEDGVRGLVQEARSALGPVSVLVNNAVARQAIRRDGTVVDADRAAWHDALDVDLLAAAELCRLLIPGMIAGGHGSIINITSTAVELGYPRLAAYSACKAGLEALARQISADFGRQGVRANVIQPGSLVHEVRDHGNQKRLEEIRARCLTRPVEAHDIALAVVFLASRESEVITGVVLPIDGGMSTVIPTTI